MGSRLFLVETQQDIDDLALTLKMLLLGKPENEELSALVCADKKRKVWRKSYKLKKEVVKP